MKSFFLLLLFFFMQDNKKDTRSCERSYIINEEEHSFTQKRSKVWTWIKLGHWKLNSPLPETVCNPITLTMSQNHDQQQTHPDPLKARGGGTYNLLKPSYRTV